MSGDRMNLPDHTNSSALPHHTGKPSASPDARESIRNVTGLSEAEGDHVADGLTETGVGLVVPNGTDTHARYADAISLVQDRGFGVVQAAREVGVNASHLSRKINELGAKSDMSAAAYAADQRILETSQTLSALSAEKLLERIEKESDTMETPELTKIYKAASDTVATKQQWAKGGGGPPGAANGVSALARLLEEGDITITKRKAEQEAIDVTPD